MPPRLRIFAMLLSPPASVFLLLAVSLSCGKCEKAGIGFRFSFDGSVKDRSFGAEFDLYGDAEVSGSAITITRPANASSGRMAYRRPIRFFGTKLGFSSSFSFSISPGGGGGFAFFLSPTGAPLERENGDRAESSTSLMAVSFATAKTGNLSRSLIEITVSGEVLAKSSNLSANGSVPYLNRGEKLHSWIDFDGDSKRIQVKLWRNKDSTPMNSPTSYAVDLSKFLRREAILVSLTSWSRNSMQGSSIYCWNFTARHGAPYLMHSEPLDPNSFLVRPTQSPPVHQRRAYPWGIFIAMVFAAACGATVAFFLMFVRAELGWRCPVAPVDFSVGVDYGTTEASGEKGLKSGNKE